MTAHASKGLEADYVIIDGVARGKHGFPSEIADDPVLSLVLPDSDQFEFAEERRLFYVALTRAKKRVYIISDAAKQSEFVREILEDSAYEKVVAGRKQDSSRLPVRFASAAKSCAEKVNLEPSTRVRIIRSAPTALRSVRAADADRCAIAVVGKRPAEPAASSRVNVRAAARAYL